MTNLLLFCFGGIIIRRLHKNFIKTSKYNVLTFLPVNLFEQFQRIANAYFLFLLVLQLVPQVSSLSWTTTVIPLLLVLIITAVKDAIDDYNRHQSDKQVNNRYVKILSNKKEKWMHVQVGDIIKLQNNQFVTADVLLLTSSEPHGLVYIETAELDGETNLKVKQALTVTSVMGEDIHALAAFDGDIKCEIPNNKLDKFVGTLTYQGNKYPLNVEKLLLRGCVLRNTEWCFGLVIFAGPETKLMQNSGLPTFKRTSIDRLMNVLVLWIFGFLAIMCTFLAFGNAFWQHNIGYYFQTFLPWQSYISNSSFSGFLVFWSYVIILNTVVPISLYVSVEIIRLGNSFYIDWDRKMYYPKKDFPAKARTTTLNEELGQIKYIFSDKTGTLTQNIMAFNKCTINGVLYGETHRDGQDRGKTPKLDFSFNPMADSNFVFYDKSLVEAVNTKKHEVHEFFRLLSLCNTVMPDEKQQGKLVYQAQSPDEGALVTAARNFGFVLKSRTPETITIIEMGKPTVYKMLAILDFDNIRKRMSVIVRSPAGKLHLYCKGADTVLFAKLSPSSQTILPKTVEHLNEFAGIGLRTLLLASKELNERAFNSWQKRHLEASTSVQNREEKLQLLYEEIERDLHLIGGTAVEDKLQRGVPLTIEKLSEANIKIWVLTGDKLETAVNIGYACNLLQDEMNEVFIIEADTPDAVHDELWAAREQMTGQVEPSTYDVEFSKKSKTPFVKPETIKGKYGLVISGTSLVRSICSRKKLKLDFLTIACSCEAVICCRVTPLQKAHVVELVKKHTKAITLAIGDGANDVSMIKAANIGVGVSGQEGMQAVLSSDFAFAQFRYLQRLLLVHGRWSYIRMCNFLRYFFYKNFTFTLVHFWYGFFCGFSAQTVYDEWFITLYNLVYTALPILAMSLFNQDVNDYWSLAYPQLYEPGQLDLFFNKLEFVKCVIHGIYSSLVLFYIPYGALYETVRDDGKTTSDYQSFALIAQTCLLLTVTMEIAIDTVYWTAFNHLFIWGSLVVYFAISFTMYSNGFFCKFFWVFFSGAARNILNQPHVWLTIFLTTVLCSLPTIILRCIAIETKPTFSDKIMSRQCQRKKIVLPKRKSQPIRRVSARRSGYAFSHQRGFGALITTGLNMRPQALRSPTFRSSKLCYKRTVIQSSQHLILIFF
uniref:Phospholipid-transporting ATPase n=1 Tax=Callorhinchus milii TaxID=7868 RepID=A0A4W3JZC5_CALMI